MSPPERRLGLTSCIFSEVLAWPLGSFDGWGQEESLMKEDLI